MDIASTAPPPKLPDVSLAAWLVTALERRGDHPAMVEAGSGASIRSAELALRIRRVAGALAQRGFCKGDVLALYARNSIDYAVAFLACNAVGGVVTTANPAYTDHELARQLADSRARLLLAGGDVLDKAHGAARSAGVGEVIDLDGPGAGAGTFAGLLESAPLQRFVAVDPRHDLAALPYSSGTTGTGKGVMLTHHNLIANVVQVAATGLARPTDISLAVLPFFHIYGMTAVLFLALHVGATLVILRRFDFTAMLHAIATWRVTLAALVPPIIQSLAHDPRLAGCDVSSLRHITSGAAPLAAAVAREVEQRLCGVRVLQGYGLTETSPVTHICPLDRPAAHIGSSGQLVAGTECRIVDADTLQPVPAEQPGEIWVRGPQIMRGYLGRPDATAAMITPEGWLRTGDIGYVSADGYLYVVDRLKELIKYRGQQVAPAELEALLLEHPAVADAAVVPRRDPDAGEVPLAFVVRRGSITADELIAYIAALVAPHKKVRCVEFIAAIPRSASGKILRRELRDRSP